MQFDQAQGFISGEPVALEDCSKTETKYGVARQVVLLLDLHRGGTSTHARVLDLLGGARGVDCNARLPCEANNTDRGQSFDLVAIHDEILQSNASSWYDWKSFDRRWYESDIAKAHRQKITDLLCRNFSTAPLIAINDPRICRFVPFWVDIIKDFDAEPLVIIPVRNPLEVIASLSVCEGFSPAKSALLWLRHVLDAEMMSRGLPRAIVRYEALINDWKAAISKANPNIRFDYTSHEAIDDTTISDILLFGIHDIWSHADFASTPPALLSWVTATDAVMAELASNGETSTALDRMENIRNQFEAACAIFGPVLSEKERQLAEHTAKLALLIEENGLVQNKLRIVQRALRESSTLPGAEYEYAAQSAGSLDSDGAQSTLPKLLGNVADYNLVAYRGRVLALAQSLGDVDVTVGAPALIERHGADRVIVADCADGARAQVEARLLPPQSDRLEPERQAAEVALSRLDILTTERQAAARALTLARRLDRVTADRQAAAKALLSARELDRLAMER